MRYRIAKNVEIPKGPPPLTGQWAFLEDMEIGESFFMETETERNQATTNAYRHKIPVTSRRVKGGYRIWRVAKDANKQRQSKDG